MTSCDKTQRKQHNSYKLKQKLGQEAHRINQHLFPVEEQGNHVCII